MTTSHRGFLRTHLVAAVGGALMCFAVQGVAQDPLEDLLNKAPLDDMKSLRTYLGVKARDLDRYQFQMEKRLQKLDAQIAALEKNAKDAEGSSIITAPFSVVDKKNRVILQLSGDGASGGDLTLGGPGVGTISLMTAQSGARMEVASEDNPDVQVISSNQDSGVYVREGTTPLAFFGRTRMEIGDEIEENVSVVTVNNLDGEPIAAMTAESDGGFVRVLDPAGKEIAAALYYGPEGGRLRAFNSAGEAVAGLMACAPSSRPKARLVQ